MSVSYEVPSRPRTSWLAKLRGVFTVEPVILLFAMAKAIMLPTLAALTYRKVCLSHFSPTICNDLSNTSLKEIEMLVQAGSSYWLLLQNLCKSVPVLLLCFFYGSLSDNVSRKSALLIPVSGHVIAAVGYLIQAIYVDLPVVYLLVACLMVGISGGWASCNMAAFSYMSDITTEKTRTFRIAVGEALVISGIGVSVLTGGVLLDVTGFRFVISLSLGIYCVLLLYIIFWIKEPSETESREAASLCATLKVLCSLKSLRDAVGCIFRKRKQGMRALVIGTCISVFIANIAVCAPLVLIYLYVTKQPLSFSSTLFGVYVSYTVGLAAIGMVVIMPILTKRMRIHEATFFLYATVSSASGLIMLAFSVRTWLLFTAPVIGCLGFCIQPVQRSLLSKLVEKNEYGRLFAMYGVMQSLGVIGANILYQNVYPRTLHIWPGSSFALAAALLSIPFVLGLYLRSNMKKLDLPEDARATDTKSNTFPKPDAASEEQADEMKSESDCTTALVDRSENRGETL